ncbi:hypothetical protein ACSBR2_030947 [Camellia fascicularis]
MTKLGALAVIKFMEAFYTCRKANKSLRFFVDGSWRKDTMAAGFAWICYSSQQCEVARRAVGLHLSSPLMAEAKAVMDALSWAKDHQLKCLHL